MRGRGSANVEMLVLLPVLLLLVFGGLELGRAALLRAALGDGAWRAARYLSVVDPWDEAGAAAMVQQTVARNAMGGGGVGVVVRVTDSGSRAFGSTITVQAEADYCPAVPLLTPRCLTLRAEHSAMVEVWP